MNRLQKKCFIGVTLLHALPLLIAVVGTAFFNKPETVIDSPRIIEIIPDNAIVTDGPTRGGSPATASAPESAPEPATKPAPAPQKPTPQPEPDPEPEPPKPVVETPKFKPVEKEIVSELPVPKKDTKRKPVPTPQKTEKTATKPAPIKRKIDISKPITVNSKKKQNSAAAAAQAADQLALDQRRAALNSSLKNLGRNLSGPTSFDRGGSGGSGGGQAEINYGDLVLHKYDAAWIAPLEVDDDVAIAKAKIIIARNGNVISSEIIKGSGNAILDKSVRRALDSVRSIAPFPAGSGDSQRTYIINFNLKSKRGIG